MDPIKFLEGVENGTGKPHPEPPPPRYVRQTLSTSNGGLIDVTVCQHCGCVVWNIALHDAVIERQAAKSPYEIGPGLMIGG